MKKLLFGLFLLLITPYTLNAQNLQDRMYGMFTTADSGGYAIQVTPVASGGGGTISGNLNDRWMGAFANCSGTPCLQVTIVGGSSGGTPGGADEQIQFNDNGVFGTDPGFTWDKVTRYFTIVGTGAFASLNLKHSLTVDHPALYLYTNLAELSIDSVKADYSAYMPLAILAQYTEFRGDTNHLRITPGSSTGNPVTLTATGSDTNVPIYVNAKGASPIHAQKKISIDASATFDGGPSTFTNGAFAADWGVPSTAVGTFQNWVGDNGGVVLAGTADPGVAGGNAFVFAAQWKTDTPHADNHGALYFVGNAVNAGSGMPANSILAGFADDYGTNILSVVASGNDNDAGARRGKIGINQMAPTALLHISVGAATVTTGLLVDTGLNINFAGLTASRLVATDASKNLVSTTLANITKLTNLTSNGFVKTSGGDGTLSVQAAGITASGVACTITAIVSGVITAGSCS